MKQIFILLKKEIKLLKGNFFSYIILSFLLPLLLYLCFSIPLSLIFVDMKPIYKAWSLPGVCFISTLFILLIILYPNIKEKIYSEYIFTIPISINNLIFSIYLFSFILSFIQFLLSLLLICSLNNQYIQFMDFFLMYLILVPSILFFINFIILISLYIQNNTLNQFVLLSVFIFTSFGLGSFIPLNYYPENYQMIFKYFPLSCTILNIQRINAASGIFFSYYIISIVYSAIITLITFLLFHNKIKNRLF